MAGPEIGIRSFPRPVEILVADISAEAPEAAVSDLIQFSASFLAREVGDLVARY